MGFRCVPFLLAMCTTAGQRTTMHPLKRTWGLMLVLLIAWRTKWKRGVAIRIVRTKWKRGVATAIVRIRRKSSAPQVATKRLSSLTVMQKALSVRRDPKTWHRVLADLSLCVQVLGP